MSIFQNFMNIPWLIKHGICAILAIVVHELSHGYVAYRLGDPTAKSAGRLTLNPIKHLDLIGTILLMTYGFGWTKPVPVDYRYFKDPKKGMAITALAGPVSNFLFAIVCLFLITCLGLFRRSNIIIFIADFLLTLTSVNIGLGIFNLIPCPPLDGSKVLFSFLPDHVYSTILQYEAYGMILLIILLNTNILSGSLDAVSQGLFNLLWTVAAAPVELINRLIF